MRKKKGREKKGVETSLSLSPDNIEELDFENCWEVKAPSDEK